MFCLLLSASSLSACGARLPPVVSPVPPRPDRPCELPNVEKAAELQAQTDIDKPLAGDEWVRLQTQDAVAYNLLYPRYNANIEWASGHCVAKPGDTAKPPGR